MKVFVVFSLSEDVPGVAVCPCKRVNPALVVPAAAVDGGVGAPGRAGSAVGDCARLEEENRLMKEELNELYLKYDHLCAAFGEMNHFIAEAAAAAGRFPGEGEA